MRSDHHQHHPNSAGSVLGPGLLYGSIGLILTLTVYVLGLFERGDLWLEKILLDLVFDGELPYQLPAMYLVIITAVFCYGLALAVMDSAGTWRRVVLGITVLIIVLAMVPTFAVWQVYCSPFLLLVGVFWTWFCSMMYVNHHQMPCELSTPATHDHKPAEVKESQVDG